MPRPKAYEYERLVDQRKVKGKTEYLVKWKDYPESANSWEPENSFKDLEVLKELQKELEIVRGQKTPKKVKTEPEPKPEPKPKAKRAQEVPVKNKAKKQKVSSIKIIGLQNEAKGNGFKFVVVFDDSRVELIQSEEANRLYPKEVIAFYERRVSFEQIK